MSQANHDLTDTTMLDLFRVEMETQAALLNEGLLALEVQPGALEAIEPLMRAAHSIKGAARIVGFDSAVQLAHAMEDCLEEAKKGKLLLGSSHIDLLLQGVDFFAQASHIEPSGMTPWFEEKKVALESLAQAIQQAKEEEVSLSIASSPNAKTALDSLQEIHPSPASEKKTTPSFPFSLPAEANSQAVRVTAESLDRLVALAAESLVEVKQLDSLIAGLQHLKKDQRHLSHLFSQLKEKEKKEALDQETQEIFFSASQALDACQKGLGKAMEHIELYSRQTTNLADRLYEEVILSRMRPFEDAVVGFPRLVRDLTRQMGKKARLEILGKKTEVDREILQKLESPLTHLIRNALDHGIETPQERVQAGKPEEGSLQMEARHQAGMLLVTLKDDGCGINVQKLQGKVIEKGLVKKDMVSSLSSEELFDFLFLPGFTTAETVSEISGRGVGLDIVQSCVHEAGGSVQVTSPPGEGTTFQLQLPITRSVLRSLLVEIGGEPYAFPLARIDRALIVPLSKLKSIENRQFFDLDNQPVGLIAATQVLELPASQKKTDEVPIVIISERHHRYGLAVDRFLGERDLVVRPLDPRLGKVPDISSASLMEDGTPVLIIDVEDIARSMDTMLSRGELHRIKKSEGSKKQDQAKRILVVDDSITVREVERKLLENQGYEVEVAVDGREGWNIVRLHSFDLVISDIDMPRMNGIELVRQLKQDMRLKDLPVMIVSYKDREEDRLQGLEAGANYYLTKSSFHDETLVQAVRDLIGEA